MMKKILTWFLLIFTMLLVGCTEEDKITLPDLTGKSRDEITETLEKSNISYTFKFAEKIINSDDELDKFVSYGHGLQVGSSISKDEKVVVYTTVLPLTGNHTSEVKIDFEWENKSFIEDGVGQVTLNYCVDGDTASFRDIKTGQIIKLRFLGINTRESTIEEEPWGKAASDYVKSRLKNAKTIILDANGATKDMYGRYLGLVWVDGILLNLEIIDQAYSNSTLSISDSRYGEVFMKASIAAKKTGRRFFGEIDPDYDYENKRFK